MNIVTFVARQRPYWQELERLLAKVRQRGRMEKHELHHLSKLYRAAAADYAFASTHFEGHDIVQYLNSLLSEAHGIIYQRRRIRIGDFFTWLFLGVPAIFVKHVGKFALAAGIFLVFGTAGFMGSEFIEDGESLFLSFSITQPEYSSYSASYYIDMTEENIRDGDPFAVYSGRHQAIGASRIMFNNIRVSIYCFAGGIIAGIVTFWVLAMNSMMVGAFFHIFYRHGIIFDFWNTTLLHGMIELSMMVMAAMAGFIIAKGLLFPGSYTLRDSMKRATLDAMQLIIAVAMWDGIAALIEGFLTGAHLSTAAKVLVNLITFSMLVAYFGYLGYKGHQRRLRLEREAAAAPV